MSENRKPREVPANTDSVSSRLATFANKYVRYVADKSTGVSLPIPVSAKFNSIEDVRANMERNLRALNWAFLNRAVSVEASNLARGTLSKADEAEKIAHATAYLNGETRNGVAGYAFTDDLGGEWSNSILELAADRVLFAMGVAQKKYTGSYDDNNSSALVEKRKPTVTKILTDPALADKYTAPVQEMVATILAERPPMQKRGGKVELVTEEIEL